jgi:hypothetical protein
MLLLMLLGFALPSFAGAETDEITSLHVCNKGNVHIDAISVRSGNGYRWFVLGWLPIPPHECNNLFAEQGDHLHPAYIGFAFTDSAGAWGPATVDPPSYGTDASGNATFTRADMQFCVARKPEVIYGTNSEEVAKHCEDIHSVKGPDDAKFFPFPTALYFHPKLKDCPLFGSCTGGDYYLEIEAPSQGHHLMVNRGLSPDEKGWKMAGDFLNALARAGAEDRQRREQAEVAAEEERLQRARGQQAAREEQQKRIKAAAAAGDRDAQVPAQIIARAEEDNRQRWAGSRQSPASYDPKWMGQNVTIVGTVSRVEVNPGGVPQWVTIYFKESPDATFVVCSPYPDLFQEKLGLNLSVLIGKTLEAAGQVESPYCGHKVPKASIRVVESKQWQVH